MTLRRIDLLITEARADSDNVEFSDSTGISDESFLRWSNSAQDRLLSIIQKEFPDVWQKEKIVNAVQGQESYDMPAGTYNEFRVRMVEFSSDGNPKNFRPLKKGQLAERINGNSGDPDFYIRQSDKLLIQPPPQSSSGTFRITVQRKFPKIDKRRARIAEVTLDDATKTITALTFDTTISVDSTRIVSEGYMSVVTRDGVQKMVGIPVSSVNETSGVVILESGFVFEDGETIEVGDWVCAGADSTTHSELTHICERYVTEFMIWKATRRDSSGDSVENNGELKEIELDILDTFREPDAGISFVPIISGEYLEPNDSW